MCGITGIISGQQLSEDRKGIVLNMMDSIRHRGPDGDGIQVFQEAILGHLRLAIIDVQHGAQPMNSDDERYSLVFNGEIYNYIELRQDLSRQGVNFQTFSDTEVLLKLLMAEGKNALNKLNGMFAFVFYDSHTNEWIAARDSFGIKPFYYTVIEDELIFGSEIKAILQHPLVQTRQDQHSLQQYFTFQFCLGERTMFEGVKKVEPGQVLTGKGATIKHMSYYWDTNYHVDQYHTEDYFIYKLHALLEDSVKLQIRSDVPLGGYLSGGLDSSIVCSLAAMAIPGKLSMFHGRFAEGKEFDESDYAKSVVENSNGDYHEVVPTSKNFVEYMPGLMKSLDEPVAGPGLFPQYCVSKLASKHVKVILGGQGGDEIFGGYARYLIGYLEQALKGAIFETQEEGKHLVSLDSIIPSLPLLKQYVPLLKQFWSEGLFEDMDRRYFKLIDRSPDLMNFLTGDVIDLRSKVNVFDDFQKVFNHADTKSYINKMTHFDQKTLLPALLQIEDRVSMSVSIESRVPLLDTRIVDLVTTMPLPIKFQTGQTKHILKKSIKSIVPAKVMDRKDKMGFPVPLSVWMKEGEVRDFVSDTLLSKKSVERGIYKKSALESMISNNGVGGRQLWGALSLELWNQQYMDK
jgi:asparagine synthase (glutamine-hydrolysing)